MFYTSADGASRLVLGSRLQTHATPCVVVVVIFVRLCPSLSVSHARSLARLHFQLPVFFFRPNFDLKNMISSYIKRIIHGNNIARFRRKKGFQIARFLLLVPVCSQEYRRILCFFCFFCFFLFLWLLSYLVWRHIWLNHLMDDRHFSYITKLGKK